MYRKCHKNKIPIGNYLTKNLTKRQKINSLSLMRLHFTYASQIRARLEIRARLGLTGGEYDAAAQNFFMFFSPIFGFGYI